ncbi:MAG: hypothetical protein RLZZ367_210 [Bacteroidota bacterium]|jgi:hypothetical protein
MVKGALTILISTTVFVLSAQQTDSANKSATGINRANATTGAIGATDKTDKNALGVARPLPAAVFTDTIKIASPLKQAK